MGISYELFDQSVEAHLEYALDLPPSEATSIFERRLGDNSWRSAASGWMNKLAVLAQRKGDPEGVLRVLGRFVDSVTAGAVDRAAHETLRDLLRVRLPVDALHAQRLAEWFVNRASPGDASLAADILDSAFSSRNDLIEPLAPLALWLVEHGVAELRARRRLSVTLKIVGVVFRFSNHDLLLPAIRHVLDNDERLQTLFFFDYTNEMDDLLAAIADLVERGAGPKQLVADIAREFDAEDAARYLLRLCTDLDLGLRSVALETLASGWVETSTQRVAWPKIMRVADPEPTLTFQDRSATRVALEVLASLWHENPIETEREEGWARCFAAEALRHGFSKADLELLSRTLGYPEHPGLQRGVIAALHSYIADRGDSASLVGQLLATGGGGAGATRAALRLLSATPAIPKRASVELERRVKEAVESVLEAQPRHANAEIAELLRPIKHIVFTNDLVNDDKVEPANSVLRVDRNAIAGLMSAGLDDDELVAASTLYVFHEVVHLWQRIGDKSKVTQIRATGAEATLMQIDLGADHIAAMVVASATSRWSLTALKDIGGRTTAAFPTEAHHTTAARARKAHRLVGNRLDYLVRVHAVLAEDADEYAFAEYGPMGGPLIVLRSGPPWGVLGVSALNRQDAESLHTAADHGYEGLKTVDRILSQAIKTLR